MTAISLINAKNNLSQLISEVNLNNEPVIIINDNGENAVLLSQDEWNSIQETLYLYSVPGIVDSVIEADREPLSEYTDYKPDEEW